MYTIYVINNVWIYLNIMWSLLKYKEYLWDWRFYEYVTKWGGCEHGELNDSMRCYSDMKYDICGFNIVFELYGHIIFKEEWYDM